MTSRGDDAVAVEQCWRGFFNSDAGGAESRWLTKLSSMIAGPIRPCGQLPTITSKFELAVVAHRGLGGGRSTESRITHQRVLIRLRVSSVEVAGAPRLSYTCRFVRCPARLPCCRRAHLGTPTRQDADAGSDRIIVELPAVMGKWRNECAAPQRWRRSRWVKAPGTEWRHIRLHQGASGGLRDFRCSHFTPVGREEVLNDWQLNAYDRPIEPQLASGAVCQDRIIYPGIFSGLGPRMSCFRRTCSRNQGGRLELLTKRMPLRALRWKTLRS